MRILFVDGWPFRNPKLHVAGLDEWHLSASGEVCLWAPGAASGDWLTVEGFMRRIDEWVERAKKGFRPEDFALDAHLSFGKTRAGAIATLKGDREARAPAAVRDLVGSRAWAGGARSSRRAT